MDDVYPAPSQRFSTPSQVAANPDSVADLRAFTFKEWFKLFMKAIPAHTLAATLWTLALMSVVFVVMILLMLAGVANFVTDTASIS